MEFHQNLWKISEKLTVLLVITVVNHVLHHHKHLSTGKLVEDWNLDVWKVTKNTFWHDVDPCLHF